MCYTLIIYDVYFYYVKHLLLDLLGTSFRARTDNVLS